MISETRQTHSTGSDYYDYSTGGYNCPHCGAWVFHNQLHSCYPQFPSYSPDYSPYMTWQPNYIQLLTEVKALLEKLIELLSRE